MPPSLRDHVRAALIALHLVAIVGMAIPSPRGFSSGAAIEQGGTARAMAAWEEGLATVGVPAELTRGALIAGGRLLERAEGRFERAFAPYVRFAGVKQSWRMFSGSPPRAARFEVWIREGGAWRVVYRALDPDARWRAGLWEDGRVRGMVHTLAGERFAAWWEAFAHSVARRAAVDFPAADAARIQRVRLRLPAPEALGTAGRLTEGEATDVAEVAW
ncbi:MAG: hypothetical protein ACOZNI_14955 [Myxococcota bacterium]